MTGVDICSIVLAPLIALATIGLFQNSSSSSSDRTQCWRALERCQEVFSECSSGLRDLVVKIDTILVVYAPVVLLGFGLVIGFIFGIILSRSLCPVRTHHAVQVANRVEVTQPRLTGQNEAVLRELAEVGLPP